MFEPHSVPARSRRAFDDSADPLEHRKGRVVRDRLPSGRMLRAAFGATLLVLIASADGLAQARSVRGQVVDGITDRPLVSAAVQVPGTGVGTFTDADGSFSIEVPSGDVTLRVSIIGFKTAEVMIGADETSAGTIALETDVLRLGEIVVTGQATGVARRNLANAVSTVSADELVKAPTSSVEQNLQGKVVGMRIRNNSGSPGGGLTVDIRGVSSIIGEVKPLWVVDGVIVSDESIPAGANALTRARTAAGMASMQEDPVNRIADLNPDDIESVEVLKGASAAAIYGSKAANGVIIVTTRRGRAGPPQFRVRQQLGTAAISKKVGSREFISVEEAEEWGGPAARDAYLASGGHNFDQDDLIAGENPFNVETSASMRGGMGGFRYYASGLVRHEGGIVQNTYADKQTLRLNFDQELSARAGLSVSTGVVHAKNDRGMTNNDNTGISYYGALFTTPRFFDMRRLPDGTFPHNPFASSNPLQSIELVEKPEEVWRITGSAQFDVEALETERHGLRLNILAGLDHFSQENRVFSPPEAQFEALTGLLGTSAKAASNNLNLNVNTNAVHRLSLSDGSTATTQLGFQYEIRDLDIARIFAKGLVGGQSNIDNATSVQVDQHRERVEDVGIFLQEEFLTLDERLLLTLGARADRSSTNSDTEKFYFYPKASASYRIPVSGDGLLEELKVRLAYGQSGNRPLYGQKFTSLLGPNIGGVPGFQIGGEIGADDLRPERQHEVEGGFDAILFDGRASLEFTLYNKRITDMLLRRDLAPVTGFSTQFFNGGSFRTRGVETRLRLIPVRTPDVTWTGNLSFWSDRCRISELPVPGFFPGQFLGPVFGAYFIEEGESCTQLIGNIQQPDGSVVLGHIGDANPNFQLSYSNDVTYRNFTGFFLLHWQDGGRLLNITQFELDLSGLAPDYLEPTPDGTPLGEKRFTDWVAGNSAVYQQDAGFVKLREVSLSYQLPQAFVQRVLRGLDAASLTFSGRDLLLFTSYPTGDPEVNQEPGSFENGSPWDIWAYPPSRSFWLSLDVTF